MRESNKNEVNVKKTQKRNKDRLNFAKLKPSASRDGMVNASHSLGLGLVETCLTPRQNR